MYDHFTIGLAIGIFFGLGVAFLAMIPAFLRVRRILQEAEEDSRRMASWRRLALRGETRL